MTKDGPDQAKGDHGHDNERLGVGLKDHHQDDKDTKEGERKGDAQTAEGFGLFATLPTKVDFGGRSELSEIGDVAIEQSEDDILAVAFVFVEFGSDGRDAFAVDAADDL